MSTDQPFDPAAFGFVETFDHYRERQRCWRIGKYRMWQADGWCGIDEVCPTNPVVKVHGVYFGAWPESHSFAVELFKHLGLEIQQ
jgi:hypothetical protein